MPAFGLSAVPLPMKVRIRSATGFAVTAAVLEAATLVAVGADTEVEARPLAAGAVAARALTVAAADSAFAEREPRRDGPLPERAEEADRSEDASDAEESPRESACATTGTVSTAIPTPKETANAPTRPTYAPVTTSIPSGYGDVSSGETSFDSVVGPRVTKVPGVPDLLPTCPGNRAGCPYPSAGASIRRADDSGRSRTPTA